MLCLIAVVIVMMHEYHQFVLVVLDRRSKISFWIAGRRLAEVLRKCSCACFVSGTYLCRLLRALTTWLSSVGAPSPCVGAHTPSLLALGKFVRLRSLSQPWRKRTKKRCMKLGRLQEEVSSTHLFLLRKNVSWFVYSNHYLRKKPLE